MDKTIRLKTEIGKDKFLKLNLEQDFDFLEVLSMKLTQEEVYKQYNSDYGVIVGRVYCNSGLGLPNCKVSVFIPYDSNLNIDKKLYPFSNIKDIPETGIRYNLLTEDYQNDCHSPVGTFPNKNKLLDNNNLLEVFKNYYKFTTTTNKSGDFMLFGVPVGNHLLNVDVDLSDVGIFSQRPYNFIDQGSSAKQFASSTKFKVDKNLNYLTQIKHQEIGVNVIPFWGENLNNEIGISRVDVDLNFNIEPTAIFIGSIFGDNDKNSVNKNCIPRKDLGRICETISNEGTINMIRKTLDGQTENFDIDGGRLIDEDGTWAYSLPMNLDYLVTDELGNLVPSDDPSKGIPTRCRSRFKISVDDSGGEGRLRTHAKYLVPHNPINSLDQDFSFGEETSDNHFRDFYWNKIYTVRNHITRIQNSCNSNCSDNRRMIGIKDVDNCVGLKNPFPFNRLDGDFNPIFLIICIIIGIIIFILSVLNGILSFLHNIKFLGIRPFKSLRCITLSCDGYSFAPGCYGNAANNGVNTSSEDLHECYKLSLAESLNIYEFDFYNDWINGTLFSFLLKYKKKENVEKFCDVDNNEDIFIVDTLTSGSLKSNTSAKISHGLVKKYNGELFYSPFDKDQEYLLFATDILNLGSVFDCDWQSKPSIHKFLIPTTYQLPPKFEGEENGVTEMANDGKPNNGLLFNLTCVDLTSNSTQIENIKRLCEIGVGLDEDRSVFLNGTVNDGVISNEDIENQFIRDALIYLNSNSILPSAFPLNSGFNGLHYNNYRNSLNRNVDQFKGNSFYFYFGTSPNNSAIDKMNRKYFTTCDRVEKPDFIINGVVSNVTSIGGNNGSINISIVGGVGPYTYLWSNNQITEDINNLTFGEYTVIVTDFNGSINKRTFRVNQPQPINCEFTIRTTSGVGNNDGKLFINSIFGGNNDYTMILSGPSGIFNIVNPTLIYQFNNLISGSYVLTITDTSTPQLSTTYTIDILDPTPLSVTTTFTNSDCDDPNSSSIKTTVSGGIVPYSVITNGINLVNSSGQTINYSSTNLNQFAVPNGNYSVSVTDSVGQNVLINGTIVIPEQINLILSRVFPDPTNISGFPFRVRITNYVPGLTYDFFKNVDTTIIGTVVAPNSGFLLFDYPNFVLDDKLFVIERDNVCTSNIITITQNDL
jgi:hypothetical protein